MTARSITLVLLVTLALGSACESNRATQPVQPRPDPSVLTTLEAVPTAVTLEQGSTVELRIVARDQRSVPMTHAGIVIFSSSDSTVARVNGSGSVTGVAAGTADISVTKTVVGVTRSATMTATIRQARLSPIWR